jgi:hypothetical protein
MLMFDLGACLYKIPKGTRVIINHWALHNCPCALDDIDRFVPHGYLYRAQATKLVAAIFGGNKGVPRRSCYKEEASFNLCKFDARLKMDNGV